MKIDDGHVLPCDFICGHMRFGKGTKLETVREAAERWLAAAMESKKLDPDSVERIHEHLRT